MRLAIVAGRIFALLFLVFAAPALAQQCPFGPFQCKQGLVWREIVANDKVCVTGAVRSRIAADNAARLSRRDPASPDGPLGCKAGFVWRNAIPGDKVCVTAATRSATRTDNLNREVNIDRACLKCEFIASRGGQEFAFDFQTFQGLKDKLARDGSITLGFQARSGDGLRIVVTQGGAPAGSTLLTLDNDPRITWDKEVRVYNRCDPGFEQAVTKRIPGVAPTSVIRVARPGIFADPGVTSLAFRKPGFLGVWRDVAELNDGQFQELARGNRVKVVWVFD